MKNRVILIILSYSLEFIVAGLVVISFLIFPDFFSRVGSQIFNRANVNWVIIWGVIGAQIGGTIILSRNALFPKDNNTILCRWTGYPAYKFVVNSVLLIAGFAAFGSIFLFIMNNVLSYKIIGFAYVILNAIAFTSVVSLYFASNTIRQLLEKEAVDE